MNVRSIPNFVSAAAIAAALQIGTSAAHATAASVVPLGNDAIIQQAQPMAFEWTEEKRIHLRRAYWLLEHANANYEGHKAKAMEFLKKAGEHNHIDLHGKGYENEHHQGKSDEMLRQAREELKDFDRESNAKDIPHIVNAIREINHALKVN